MNKKISVICISVLLLNIIWILFISLLTISAEEGRYRFDGVYAKEGTVLKVTNGELKLVSIGGFSREQPLVRKVSLALWGLLFISTAISWLYLRKKDKEKNS